MTQYTDEIRTCIRDGCGKTFRVKVKGQIQVYCGNTCRVAVYHESLPSERRNQWQRNYYYRNQPARQTAARNRGRRRCECGRLKATVKDPMCSDCAAIVPVGNRP